MTRFICTIACCLMTLALVADGRAADQSGARPGPAAEKSEKDTKKPKQEAEKPAEKPAEKSKEAAKEPEKPAEKPREAAKKPEKSAEKPKPAAKKPEKPADDGAETPPTVTVEPGLLKIEVSLKGNFEPQSMREIVLRPESWSTFKVVKAVEHGEEVKRDERLVEFEMDDIDDAIVDQKRKVELADLAVKQARKSLDMLEQTTPLDLAAAERTKRHSDEDLAYHFKVDRPMSEKVANHNVKTSENYLEYQREELRQLEKMYEADDLTEETEEIILKRQRDAVERAEFFLEMDKIRRDETLKTRLPRLDESMKQSNVRAALSLDETKATLPMALRRARLDLAKLEVTLEKEGKKLEELQGDRAAMEVKAPMDGVVYYGQFKRGEWSGANSGADKLKKHGSVSANEVFMTVVKPRPLAIRVKVPEKDIHQFRPGLKGKVQPTGYPDMRLSATVTDVGEIPFTAGNFEALLRVGIGDDAQAIVPGMSATVKFIPYLKKRTLTVPPSAVHTDELDDQKHYVCLLTEDGKQQKLAVTVGRKTEEKIEILDGLVPGDEVLKEFPKDKK